MSTLMAIPAAAIALWVSSFLNTANRSVVIKETLAIVGLYALSFRHEIPVPAVSLSWAIATALAIVAGFSYVGSKRSRFLGDREMRLQSEPVFFRCRTHHTRLFPKKHSFAYSVLQAGIPLSFRGSIGRLFTFNNGYNDSRDNDKKWSLFGVDSRDYLRRGDETLEEKMRFFLKENDMNLEDYPMVYLVTAPRFLGYQFNPVSFWYLKNKDAVLSLVVVEVNNTFDERHMYILRPSKTDNATPPVEGRRTSISNSFPKSFHVSPFNDRTGKYHILTRDPLSASDNSKILVNTVITLYDDYENKKLIAAIRSIAAPIFISDLSASTVASLVFVVKYGWTGLITFPRIVWEAAQLFGLKKLKVYFRPEVKGKTISRNATPFEMQLEKYFRKYLQSRVQEHTRPIIVHYSAAGVGSLPQNETFLSSVVSKDATLGAAAKELDIVVFSPRFYVAWMAGQSARTTLVSEMLSKSKEKRTVEVSNIEMTVSLLDKSENIGEGNDGRYPDRKMSWHFIRAMRGLISSRPYPSRQNLGTKAAATHPGRFGITTSQPSSCQNFLSETDRQMIRLPNIDSRVYGACMVQALLTETIGLGDEMLLRGYDFAIRGILIYFAWRGFVEGETPKSWGAVGSLTIWRMLKGAI